MQSPPTEIPPNPKREVVINIFNEFCRDFNVVFKKKYIFMQDRTNIFIGIDTDTLDCLVLSILGWGKSILWNMFDFGGSMQQKIF